MLGLIAILYFLIGGFAAVFIANVYGLDDGYLAVIIGIVFTWPILLILFGSLWAIVTLIDFIRRMM